MVTFVTWQASLGCCQRFISLPWGHLCGTVHKMVADFPQQMKERARENKMEARTLCNLILEVTYHRFAE